MIPDTTPGSPGTPDSPGPPQVPGGADPHAGSGHAAADLADLAGAVLALSREIELRHSEEPDVAPLPITARMVLRQVDRHPGATPSAIAAATGLQRSNVSAALRTLEGHGLVERRAASGDGRGVTVHPTARAAANLRALRRIWSRTLAPALPTDTDAAGLAALLLQLTEDLGDLRRGAPEGPEGPEGPEVDPGS